VAQYIPDPAGLPAWDLIEELGVNLSARYADAEDTLIKAVAVRAQRDLELQEIVRTSTMTPHMTDLFDRAIVRNRALAELQATRAQSIRELQYMASEVSGKLGGREAALDVITTAWTQGEAAAAERLGMASRLAGTTALTGTSSQAATMLTLDLTSRLEKLALRISRYPQDAYQQVISMTASNTLLGASTGLASQQMAVERFLSKGITGFVDKADRNWRIGSYAEMAGRTAVNRAFNDAGVWRMQQSGVNLVTPVAADDCCEDCARYRGQILSTDGTTGTITVPHSTSDEQVTVVIFATLDSARQNGLGHPNDRCKFVSYLPGLTIPQAGKEFDPQAEADREKQRAIERDVRKYKRREAVAGTPADQKRAQLKVRAKQAQLREHTALTGRKRVSAREQLHFSDGKGATGSWSPPSAPKPPTPRAPSAIAPPAAAPAPRPTAPRDPIDVLGPRPQAPLSGVGMTEARAWQQSVVAWDKGAQQIGRDNIKIGAPAPRTSSDLAAALAKATNGKDVGGILGQQLQHRGITVNGFTAKTNVDTAREYAQTVSDLLEKYPTVVMDEVNIVKMSPRTYAHARSGRAGKVDLELNTTHAVNRDKLLGLLANDVAQGFHPAGLGNVQGIISHEFGHVIDTQTAFAQGKSARKVIVDLGKSKGYKVNSTEAWRWQHDNLPGYAFDRKGSFNGTEAIAEAFADVEVNGSRATESSRALWQHLIDGME